MTLPAGITRAYLATRPVDFRKGHAGLALIVQSVLGHDPYSGALFLFRSKRGEGVKCLVWDQTGLVLVYKKLEGGSFHWPKPSDGVLRLSPAQFCSKVSIGERSRPSGGDVRALRDSCGRVTRAAVPAGMAGRCGVSSRHGIEHDQRGPCGGSRVAAGRIGGRPNRCGNAPGGGRGGRCPAGAAAGADAARHLRAKSEKLDPDQRNLPFEDVEAAAGMLAAASETVDKALGDRKKAPRAPEPNKGHLPAHLPRVEQVIEPDSILCPCGCGAMQKVGESRVERLDVIPAQFRVLVTVRPKYVCRACNGAQHAQAPAPEWLVPRGLPTEALVAHSMVAKFGDYLPFYRQSEIYRRQGIDLNRSMLAEWSGRAAQLLAPVIDAMMAELRRSDRLQMDETTVPVLAPGTGAVRKDWLWVVLRDQRGWGGSDPPIVVFHHSPSRGGAVAQEILNGFAGGTLLVDGHTGYDVLADPKKTAMPWALAFCWTHWRRRFVKFSQDTPSPICDEMIARIASLYAIEKEIRGRDPATRRAVRQKFSKPIVEALRPWLEACLQDLSSANELARHIRYGLKRWDGLARFLEDGRLEMDTNGVENAIRPIPLTRKNALFAGSTDGAKSWARIASLIGTCKLNGVNPEAYIAATLRKILDNHMQRDITELMPWNFRE